MLESAIEFKQPNLDHNIDPWQMLMVYAGSDKETVDEAWRNLDEAVRDEPTHFAWKVLRDPAYAKLYAEKNSVQALYDAGFFVDKMPVSQVHTLEHTSHDLTTPYHKITANLDKLEGVEGKPVVLVTTGGFSPIHWGHISMMETAKHALENQGRPVIGGYISPSHDDYVSQKYGGEAKLTANHRIHLAQMAVEENDWLMIDPWESQYVPTDVNFTDVIRHLKQYLASHIDCPEFDVMYVNGADNAGFADVLKYMDGGVTVSRGSDYNELPEIFKQPDIAADPRILFVKSDDPSSEFSSASVRKWKPQLMPAEASKQYFRWRLNMISNDNDVTSPARNYFIRDDGAWAMHQYFPDGPSYEVVQQLDKFKSGLSLAIREAFRDVELPDVPLDVHVQYLPLHEQQELADKLSSERPVLNLDACTNADGGINFSRLFELAESQMRPFDLVSRPGFPPIKEQIAAIESGSYLLLDDDISSGATVNHLLGLLPDRIKIESIQTLFNQSKRLHGEFNINELSDMVDLRDFIIGSYIGGLVVAGPDRNSIVRAPYMLPFVSGHSRASLPLSTMRHLSQETWRLNAELFGSLASQPTLAEAAPEFQSLMLQLGFKPADKIADIAEYYFKWMQQTSRI